MVREPLKKDCGNIEKDLIYRNIWTAGELGEHWTWVCVCVFTHARVHACMGLVSLAFKIQTRAVKLNWVIPTPEAKRVGENHVIGIFLLQPIYCYRFSHRRRWWFNFCFLWEFFHLGCFSNQRWFLKRSQENIIIIHTWETSSQQGEVK